MEHPQKNDLFLLKKTIDATPFTYSEKEKRQFEEKYLKLESNPNATKEEIRALIIEIGKATWVHRKAYEEFIATYYKDKLEEYFRVHLDPILIGKYIEFTKGGHNIKDVRRTKEFEEYFTPEENLLIEKALFTARDEVRVSVQGTINDRSDEYNEYVKAYEQKKKDYINMIQSLREIADKSDKWSSEILNKIATFEEGWSVIERDFNEDKLRHEIEYWQGVSGLE
jgi:hypothetical protein